MIAIINYGMGNLGSIQNMLNYVGVESIITDNHEEISKADKIILPGVGSFYKGMQNLFSLNLIDILNEVAIKDRKPILGICLGMQLMTKFSEEGNIKGLSWFNAKTIKFSFDDNLKLKIPHMGWNEIVYNENSPLLKNLPKPSKFYFVHSYYVHTNNNSDIIGTCSYGNDFTCILNKDNIFGTQFHPEKSHKYGIQIFENFISL